MGIVLVLAVALVAVARRRDTVPATELDRDMTELDLALVPVGAARGQE
jgi:hypothetical protein